MPCASACLEQQPVGAVQRWRQQAEVTAWPAADDFADVMGPVSTHDTARPAASVKSVLIGRVPDRGGRPDESRGAGSMPAWSARRDDPGTCSPPLAGQATRQDAARTGAPGQLRLHLISLVLRCGQGRAVCMCWHAAACGHSLIVMRGAHGWMWCRSRLGWICTCACQLSPPSRKISVWSLQSAACFRDAADLHCSSHLPDQLLCCRRGQKGRWWWRGPRWAETWQWRGRPSWRPQEAEEWLSNAWY